MIMPKSKNKNADSSSTSNNTNQRLIHDDLILAMRQWGYKDFSEGGVCQGFELMGIQSFLSGGYQAFKDRQKFLAEHPQSKQDFDALYKKREQGKLTPEENETYQKFIDLEAFLDSLHVYQRPNKNRQLFTQAFTQNNIENVANLIQSKAIEDKGGLVALESFTNVYTIPDMEKVLIELASVFKKHQCEITFSITSGFHAIGICFSPQGEKGTWSVIDADHMSFPELSAAYGTTMLAKAVCEFSHQVDQSKTGERFAFNMKPLTTNDNLERANAALKEFKNSAVYQSMAITNDKILFRRDDGLGRSIIASALFNGDLETIKQISKINPAYFKQMAKAALGTAVLHNQTVILEEFAKQGIDLGQKLNGIYKGRTIAHIAAKNGNVDILRLLDQYNIDINQVSSDVKTMLKTPIDFARTSNRDDAVFFIESVDKRNALAKKMMSLEEKEDSALSYDMVLLRQQMLNEWHDLAEKKQSNQFNEEKWMKQINELIDYHKMQDDMPTPLTKAISQSISITDAIKRSPSEDWIYHLKMDHSYRNTNTERSHEILQTREPGTFLTHIDKGQVIVSVVDNDSIVKDFHCSLEEYSDCKSGKAIIKKYLTNNPDNAFKDLEFYPVTNRITRQFARQVSVENENNNNNAENNNSNLKKS